MLSFFQFIYSMLPANSNLLHYFHLYSPPALATLVQYVHIRI